MFQGFIEKFYTTYAGLRPSSEFSNLIHFNRYNFLESQMAGLKGVY